jgi:hypothetical protein
VPIKPVSIKEEVAFKWQAVAGAEVALYGASQSDDSAQSASYLRVHPSTIYYRMLKQHRSVSCRVFFPHRARK